MESHLRATPSDDSGARSPTARSAWRDVALPSEHGGWSLTGEPALLGLLVAFSWSGLALGLAAMLAFVARTPLKVVLVDQWRHRWLDRTRLAVAILAVELVVLVALATYAATSADGRFWPPLAVAAPLIGLELWYDMRSRSRRLIPELAGTVGIGSIATAIALAGGAANRISWGLWVVIAARSIAAIPYVRTQILRGRSRPSPLWYSDLAQLAAVVIGVVGWLADFVPGAAVVAVAVMAVIDLVAVRRPPHRAVVIGIQQMVYGFAIVAVTAIAIGLS